MPAKPTMTFIVSSFLFFITSLIFTSSTFADPIGSIKSLEKYKKVKIIEAPKTSSEIKKPASTEDTSQVTELQNDSPTIARSQFTTAVVNREPTDNVVMLSSNSDKVYFFTELSNLAGQRVTHRWQYQGKLMAEIKFNVKSDRWRVFSSKKIRPDWTGEWSVDLLDEHGNSLLTDRLEVVSTENH